MAAYFRKSAKEVSESLKQAAREIKNKNVNVCNAIKKLKFAHAKCSSIMYYKCCDLENAFQEFLSSIEICHKIGLG